MCEENAVEKLVAFEFAGISNEVEAVLAFKARNADPRLRPCYSRILYTWYTRRGDYRNGPHASFNHVISMLILILASLTMYQRARKLEDVITDASSFVSLAESQLEALSVATNALSLVDEKSTWIVMPVMPDAVSKPTSVLLTVLRVS
jgi:nuclear pore complex protein Nup160